MPLTRRSKIIEAKIIEEPVIANRYKILKKLGSGSFGTVYLILDLKSHNELKVLKKIHIGELEPDETIAAVSEARLLSKLNHPGIVKFHDSFVDGEFFCIITEYCELHKMQTQSFMAHSAEVIEKPENRRFLLPLAIEPFRQTYPKDTKMSRIGFENKVMGGDLDVKLHAWKKAGKNVDTELVVTWFIQLVLAVQYMHERRVLHRDLKTRNIFLKDNMVKIGDFGISRILLGTTDIATTFTGTPYFMAPEILRHEGYNSKSDIWSLGVILYEMFTLKRAFQGTSLMSVMFKIVECEIPDLPSKIDGELKSIYCSMMCKEPRNRISATDILKNSYVACYLKKLKSRIELEKTDGRIAKKEAVEIAQALSNDRLNSKSRNMASTNNDVNKISIQNKRPLTPKEQMKLRKREKADREAERLRRITLCTYNESRRNCSNIKEKQTREHSFVDDDKGPYGKKKHGANIEKPYDKTDEIGDNVFDNNVNVPAFHVDIKVSEFEDIDGNDIAVKPSEDANDDDGDEYDQKQYTHCFGEDDATQKLKHAKDYTHCFGEEEDSEDDSDTGDNVFREPSLNIERQDFVDVASAIPEEGELADTYYSECNDFEDDEDSSSHDGSIQSDDEEDRAMNNDVVALVGHMEHALQLTEDDTQSTFGEFDSSKSTSIRQQKIDALRIECIKSLGEENFKKVYRFLNKARFKSDRSISEDVIMKKLRKIVGNSRDGFLVEQLLFLEKQNEITKETF